MILTRSFLYSKFDEFNKKFFNDELPKIFIKLNRTKSQMGAFEYRIINGKNFPIRITISKYYEQTEKEYCNTLIHEMIHYFICIKKLAKQNEDCHGKTFQKIMNEINSKSDFNVSITNHIENKVLSNKNKEFRLLYFEYQGNKYFCRVSSTMTMKKAKEIFDGIIKRNNINLINVYSTKNTIIDSMKLCTKKIGLSRINEDFISELKLKEVA